MNAINTRSNWPITLSDEALDRPRKAVAMCTEWCTCEVTPDVRESPIDEASDRPREVVSNCP